MSKHKKTRQEKIIADLRKRIASQNQPATILAEKRNTPHEPIKPSQTIHYTPSSVSFNTPTQSLSTSQAADYSYVFRDLRKTLFLTTLAIGFQVVLFLLKK